jgi:hypothetical protein
MYNYFIAFLLYSLSFFLCPNGLLEEYNNKVKKTNRKFDKVRIK